MYFICRNPDDLQRNGHGVGMLILCSDLDTFLLLSLLAQYMTGKVEVLYSVIFLYL